MFTNIPQPVLDRMKHLEEQDRIDRQDGSDRFYRLRQIPPDSGRFLAVMAAAAPPGRVVEVGTSGGYSALWLTRACQQRGDQLTTLEIEPQKIATARQTFATAGIADLVELIPGDALENLKTIDQIAFCFIDLEKELYKPVYDLVLPRLLPGAILCADNAISHGEFMPEFMDAALNEPRLDALIVPIGKGVLVGRMQGSKQGNNP